MATPSEIVARLTLNAKEFTARFDGAIDNAVARARAGGTQVGRAFSETASDGLRSFAADVPVVGGALTGLSGLALGAAAGIGALSLAAVNGTKGLEEYTQATRGLDAVLKATGNQTGFTSDQLKAFADELEVSLAVTAESVLGAQKVLASFDGVAGTTFTRAIEAAADLSAVYGGDLASNSQKLGIVLQNLAAGEVDGLSKGFKFLGTTTLDAVAALAKAGDTAAAQTALLDALENSVGGSGETAGQGVAGAFFRLRTALDDASESFADGSGLFAGTITLMNNLTSAVDGVAGAYERARDAFGEFRGSAAGAGFARGVAAGGFGGGIVGAIGGAVAGSPDDAFADAERERRLNRDFPINQFLPKTDADAAARSAAEARKAEADSARAAAAATAEQARAADRAAAAAKAADAARVAREAAFENIRIEGAAKDQQRLRELGAANDNFFDEWLAKFKNTEEEAQRSAEKSSEVLKLKQEADFRYLSDSFYDIFSGRSGDIWGKFKELGARTLAELAAQFVISGKFDIGGTSAGGLLNSLGSAFGGSGGGGSATSAAMASIAAAAGPAAAVYAATQLFAQVAGTDPNLAAISPLASLIFKRTPEAFQSVTTSGLGTVGGAKGLNQGQSKAGAAALGSTALSTVQSLAASLGATLAPGVNLGALGVFKDQFSFDTTPGVGRNRQLFSTQDAAIEAFTRNAIDKGVLTGVNASVAKLLATGDLTTQTAKAQLLSNALKSFGAAADPTAGAIKALTDEFTLLRDVMAEAGSSAADTAKASAEYDKRLQDIRASAGQATTTLQNFLNDLGFGSSSPLALGDQAAAARAAFGAQSAAIGTAGFDQSAFVAAGQRLLDIEGQINGRTQDFFAVFNQVQAETNRAIGAITNASGITGDNPFARRTADATAATADNTSGMLEAMQNLPAQIAAALAQAGLPGSFIGGDARGFAVAA